MIKLFKVKSLKSNTKTEKISLNERTQEKEKSKGRSMVEMLGVLAIIGVLSIGGIQGYTLAMRKYKANEIINAMNKYAMTIYSSCQTFLLQNTFKYVSNLNNCSEDYGFEIMSYTDAGLGPLPSGVIDVASERNWDLMEENGGRMYGTYLLNPTIMDWSHSENSNDMVEISIMVDNKALCEVISDMVNEKDRDGYKDGVIPCKETTINGKTGYPTHMAFYVS